MTEENPKAAVPVRVRIRLRRAQVSTLITLAREFCALRCELAAASEPRRPEFSALFATKAEAQDFIARVKNCYPADS